MKAEYLQRVCKYAHMHASTEKRCINQIYGIGKAIPLQAWTGPEGSRRLRLPDFKTVGT